MNCSGSRDVLCLTSYTLQSWWYTLGTRWRRKTSTSSSRVGRMASHVALLLLAHWNKWYQHGIGIAWNGKGGTDCPCFLAKCWIASSLGLTLLAELSMLTRFLGGCQVQPAARRIFVYQVPKNELLMLALGVSLFKPVLVEHKGFYPSQFHLIKPCADNIWYRTVWWATFGSTIKTTCTDFCGHSSRFMKADPRGVSQPAVGRPHSLNMWRLMLCFVES